MKFLKRVSCLVAALVLGFGWAFAGIADAQTIRPDVRPKHLSTGPSIEDTTQAWIGRRDRVLTATVTPATFPTPGLRVEVEYTRHYWPGAAAAHTVKAERDPNNPSRWIARPVRAAGAFRSDSLFYRWRLSFQNLTTVTGEKRRTIASISDAAPHEMTVGCTDNQIETDLRTLQAQALGLDQERPQIGLALSHPVPTHSQVSVENIGFTLSSIGIAMMNTSVRMGPPPLVFFRPRAQRVAVSGVRTTVPIESNRAYRAALADGFSDPPYKLMGWGYAEPQRNARVRPRLGCVPTKHWFLHEAGYHLADGGFEPTPPFPPEGTPGAQRIFRPADTPLAVVRPGGPPYFSPPRPLPEAWHPRIWDLHMWRDPRPQCAAGGCLPLIQIESPSPIPGIRFPSNTFFRSQTFE